jgi:hypothetical protein
MADMIDMKNSQKFLSGKVSDYTHSVGTFLSSYFLLGLLCIGLFGCGHQNTIYPDTNSENPISGTQSGNPPASGGQIAQMPQGFFDESVNLASVNIGLDGSSTSSLGIKFKINPGTNPVGSFNGPGTGSRAILGIALYSGKKLSDWISGTGSSATSISGTPTINIDVKSVNGEAPVAISLLINLDCSDGGSPTGSTRLIVTTPEVSQNTSSSTPPTPGYIRMTADLTKAAWFTADVAITDPSNPATILLPSLPPPGQSPTAGMDLSALLAKFPNACLQNAVNTASLLPTHEMSSAIMISLGDDSTTTLNEIFVNRISIGADLYSSEAWGTL